jgi:hypothetical protein
MSPRRTRVLTLSAFACLAAQPALCLTAEELWAEWQSQSAAMGQIVSAQEVSADNGVLTLTGYSSRFTDGDVVAMGQVDQMVMTETGDGRVVVTMSDTYTIRLSVAPEPGTTPIKAMFTVDMPGLTITASGPSDARSYTYAAARITVEDGPITGGAGPLPSLDMTIAIADYAATVNLTGSDPAAMRYVSTSSLGGVTGALTLIPPPGEDGRLTARFALGASAATGAGSLGNLTAMAKGADVLPEDFAFDGDFRYDSAQMDLRLDHPIEGFSLQSSNAGGRLAANLSDRELGFRAAATGSTSTLQSADVPVPVTTAIGSAEIAVSVPLAASDDPQPFATRLAYQDATLSDEIWALFDPAQVIPRDPISLVADVSGSLRLLSNLLSSDPDQRASVPAELVDLSLNELRIALAGAELSGSGSAIFAPAPRQRPIGAFDLRLQGSNALLDRLQNSGLLPIEQLAMARGLLAALTRPGAAPDTVETTIQFTEGGGITANGVPLQ